MAYTKAPPVGFTDADEIKTLGGRNTPGRIRTAKHYKSGDQYSLVSYGSPIHYVDKFNQDGSGVRPREIDTELEATAGGWKFKGLFADWVPTLIPTLANEWMGFQNLLPDRGVDMNDLSGYDLIEMRAPNASVGVLEATHEGWVNQSVLYSDAYTAGVHLRAICMNSGLIHEMQIDSVAATAPLQELLNGETVVRLSTEVRAAASIDVIIDGQAWDKRTKTVSSSAVQVGSNGEYFYLRRFKAWDSNKETIYIEVEFRKQGNSIFMDKIIPLSWLQDPSRAFPVYTDATISPNSEAGDGAAEYFSDTTWSTVRGASSGTSVFNNQIGCYTNVNAGNYSCKRGFMAFDCTSLPTNFVASDGVVTMRVEGVPADAGGSVGMGPTTLADYTAAPSLSDYAGMTLNGMTEYCSRIAISGQSNNAFIDFTFNGTGVGAIVDAVMEMCVRVTDDLDNNTPTGFDSIRYDEQESADPPVFVVTYTVSSPPSTTYVPRVMSY